MTDGLYWEVRADYADGSHVDLLYAYDDNMAEEEQQFRYEEWLLSRHPDCTWYSVNLVYAE